eukprot:9512775-Lingulodinium_polyedra.AAC.1
MTAARRLQYTRHWQAEPRARNGAGGRCLALELEVVPARVWTIDEPVIAALGVWSHTPEYRILASRANQNAVE